MFQAIVTNTTTGYECTFEAETAEEAASGGAELVKNEALKGGWVEMVVANVRQVVKR